MTIPILVLGLGAQLGSVDEIPDAKAKFGAAAHCTKFIEVLNDKCPVVCTRGSISAQLLADLGYRGAIEVTGCPSQTLSVNPSLGKTIDDNLNALTLKLLSKEPIGIQHVLPSQWDRHLTATVTKVHQIFKSDRLIDIQQSGGVENFSRYFDPFGLNTDAETPDRDPDSPVMFFNVDSWAAAIRGCEFSIGTRIHGNILAAQLGMPCLVLSHDVRVNELSEQLALPWLDVARFEEIKSRSEVGEHIRFNASRFDRQRAENTTKFRKAIETVGLTPSPKILKLTAV